MISFFVIQLLAVYIYRCPFKPEGCTDRYIRRRTDGATIYIIFVSYIDKRNMVHCDSRA